MDTAFTDLAHPQFLNQKTPLPTRVRKEKGGAHGVQAEKIRIIILRRFIIPWTGPVPGKFKRGDGFAEFSPEMIFPLASPCGRKEGGFLANNRPPSLMIRISPA